MNTLIPGAPLRSLSPTTNEYQRAQGESRAAKPARAARFTLDAPEHSGTIPGAGGDILTPGVALTSNLAVIFTLNQHRSPRFSGSVSRSRTTRRCVGARGCSARSCGFRKTRALNPSTAVTEYVVHYHTERNHQGIDNELITPLPASVKDAGPVVSRERLGGILNYYYRAA